MGVIAYILLCGRPPFKGKSKNEIFQSILEASLRFDAPAWGKVSADAKAFVKEALNPEHESRPTAEALLNHRWM